MSTTTQKMLPLEPPSVGGSLFASSNMLSLRAMRAIRRVPATFIPTLAMPIFQAVAFAGTYFAITKIPGFPTDRSINWFLSLSGCMGGAFSGLGLGFAAIQDIENGFMDRLRMAPTPRAALLLGPLLSSLVRTFVVVTTVLGFGYLFGARPTQGILGILMFYVAAFGLAIVATGWGLGLAYRFRDMRGAALMQLTLFLVLFTSSAQAPMSMMQGWLLHIARVNPATNILRLSRQGFLNPPVGGVSWENTWGGLLAIVVLGTLSMWFAYTGLHKLDE